MAENSKIEWTDATFNPWIGCTKVGPGCDNCYAEQRMDTRLHRVQWGAGNTRQRTQTWGDPKRWNKAHEAFYAAHGRRRRVFCASLADVFDNEVVDAWRVDLFRLIAQCQNLDFLLLTKRIGNAHRMLRTVIDNLNREGVDSPYWPWPNVWLGATVVNQEEADRDIPKLLSTPAAVRFLSIEPMLGDIRLGSFLQRSPSAAFVAGKVAPDMPAWTRIGSAAVDWVICGGESGPGARRFAVEWAHDIVRQCKAAGVAVHVKQMGARPTWEGMAGPGEHWPPGVTHSPLPRWTEADPVFAVHLRDRKGGDWTEWPEGLRVREFPRSASPSGHITESAPK